MSYRHLTNTNRARIAALRRAGLTQSAIAHQLGVDPATVSRELRRNRSGRVGYNARTAQQKAKARRRVASRKGYKLMAGTKLYRYVTRRLAKYWSPEQIAGRLEYQTGQSPVSHVTIYAFVRAHPELKRYLRIQKRYRRRQGTAQRQQIREASNRRSIDERPKVVNDRKRLGDWEGDTIVGTSKDRTVTYAERRSGKAKALKVQGGPGLSKNVSDQTVRSFRQLPREKRRTITYDRGTEFSDHEHIETNLSLKVYFAHPHHPWERGTNENTNGLYRQFFPKKTDFSKVTQAQLDKVTRLLNTRPRKRHRFRTPDEVFRDGE